MKRMKKMLAMLLAVVMVMAMSATAFAAEKTAISLEGHTFDAYQIFSASSIDANKNLGNIVWGDGITDDGKVALYNKYVQPTEDITDVTKADPQKLAEKLNAENAKEFAQDAYKYLTTAKTSLTPGTTKLPIGYYLVVDSTTNADAYNLSVLKVSDNTQPVLIESKVDVPSVDKEIVETTETKVNEAAIGEVVNYKITGTMPSNIDDYEAYYYWFKDTLSAGLTYNEDIKVVVVNGSTTTDVTSYFYNNATTDSTTGVTTINVAIEDLLSLEYSDETHTPVVAITKDSKVVLTYSATLNEKAVIAGEGNPNKVDLEYSNNPDNNGQPKPPTTNPNEPTKNYPTGKTPEDKVVTYVTELTILKTDEAGNILTGAEFELKADSIIKVNVITKGGYVVSETGTYYKLKDGTYTLDAPQAEETDDDGNVTVESNEELYASTSVKYAYSENEVTEYVTADGGKVTKMVGTDGKVTFSGITVGDYTITETKTPVGYNTISPITFKITFDPTTKTFISDNEKVIVGEDNKLDTTIVNKKGAVLPETGGMGTRIFYVLGTVLVLGAGVLLITKRRMSAR